MKKLAYILFSILLISLIVGFQKKSVDESLGNKIIGFSVIVFVFVFLPVFIYNGWKNKSLDDYMLSDEKLKKMGGKSLKSKK